MISQLQVQQLLWNISLGAEIGLVLRLIQQKLVRRYPFFAIYLATEAIFSILLMRLQYHSRDYAQTFRTFTLLIVILRVGVAGELYERICAHFPGIGKFRLGLATLLSLIAAVIAVNIVRPDLSARWVFPQTLAEIVRRFQGEIFAGVFLFTWFFFRYALSIHQPFRPNVLSHWRIVTIYFGVSGAHALGVLVIGSGPAVHPLNCAMLAADIGCFVAWACLMKRSGEKLPWFYRLSPSEIEAVERRNNELLETVRSLPREISGRLGENPGIQ